jgi:Uma2 family endonuclease
MADPATSTPEDLYLRLLDMADEPYVELIDGEVVVHASPGIVHAFGASGLGSDVYQAYQRGRGGPGGWWILDEVDIELVAAKHCYRPDLSGWRQERVPRAPRERPVRIVPDFVCETLSESNAAWDLGPKRTGYHLAKVSWYWVLDPQHKVLTAHEWTEGGYRVAGTVTGKAPGALPPFLEVTIDMGQLFPIEEEP